MRGSWSPAQVNTQGEHDSKWPRDHNVKAQNSRDLNIRYWSLRDKELYLNRGEDDVKGPHAEGSKSAIDRETSGRNWAEPGRNGPRQVGLGQPAWPVSGPVRDALWPRCFFINRLRLRRPPHWSIHRNSGKPRRDRRTMAAVSPRSCLGDGLGLP
jgi:hypothetical protein